MLDLLFNNSIRNNVFSFRATPEVLHRVFSSIRIYYRLARWLFGHDHEPFATSVKEGLHPVPAFLIGYDWLIRILLIGQEIYRPTLIIAIIMHFVKHTLHRLSLLHKMKLYSKLISSNNKL